MASEVTFFSLLFCHLIYARLCGSPSLSYCGTKTKLHKEIEWKARLRWYWKPSRFSASGSRWTQMLFTQILLFFLDVVGNADVEMESQNPGTVLRPSVLLQGLSKDEGRIIVIVTILSTYHSGRRINTHRSDPYLWRRGRTIRDGQHALCLFLSPSLCVCLWVESDQKSNLICFICSRGIASVHSYCCSKTGVCCQ